jgi:hypothetical protein
MSISHAASYCSHPAPPVESVSSSLNWRVSPPRAPPVPSSPDCSRGPADDVRSRGSFSPPAVPCVLDICAFSS